MEEENSNSEDLFSSKNIGIGLLIVLLLPIPISLIISSGNWLSFIDGTSTVWIGFWGSYLGGIIGTLGIIYVAISQNKLQSDLNAEMIENQSSNHKDQIKSQLDILLKTEQYTRNRILLQNELNLINEYLKELHEFKSSLSVIMNIIDQYDYNKSILIRAKSTMKLTPSVEPYHEKASINLDKQYEKIVDNHMFKQADLMFSLKYKNGTIRILNYEADDIVEYSLLNSIIGVSESIKLDNKESLKEFSSDLELANESYKKIAEWIQKEVINSNSNIISISDRLKKL